jgi:hypothetical protein
MKRGNFHFNLALAVVAAGGLVLASGAQAQSGAGARGDKLSASAQSASTPHTPDGKPDLSGMWGGRGGGGGGGNNGGSDDITTTVASRRCAPNQAGCNDQTNQTVDGEFTGRFDANRPFYKPEFWDKIQELDKDTNMKDPVFQCQPEGVPRVGPPVKIVQTAKEVIFFYQAEGGAGNQPEDFRIIPTDGRKHDPVRALDVTYYGDSVGRWDGDTFVIDSVGFNDITWLARGGYFHSDLMHVIEKLHRDGDTLTYEVTVDDPQVLLKPWAMTPRVMKLNPDPNATIHEGDPCHDYDSANMSSRIRH